MCPIVRERTPIHGKYADFKVLYDGTPFACKKADMKSLPERIWLVLLGVAVAILVTLTTLYWSEPATTASGSEAGVSRPAGNRAVLPKIGTELTRQLIKPLIPSK